jgi:hypothetical protein
VTNDFVAAGGDGYAKPAAPVSIRERLDAVVSRWLSQQMTISPKLDGRINCLGSKCPALLSGTPLPLPLALVLDGGSARSTALVRPPSTGDGGLR